MAKILLVEDDEAISALAAEWLKTEHYVVELANDGKLALQMMHICDYDVVLLDWDLPGMPGFEVCRQYRQDGGVSPIIMVTAKSEGSEKIAGLDAGADDYLTKPFSLPELSARIRARLRSVTKVPSNVLQFNGLCLDPVAYKVTKGGQEISLLPKEFALLEFFMRNPDKVFSSDVIIARVWSADADATDNALRGTLKRLRAKIDTGSTTMIETIHGVGYRLRI